jgi:hypothetical protein
MSTLPFAFAVFRVIRPLVLALLLSGGTVAVAQAQPGDERRGGRPIGERRGGGPLDERRGERLGQLDNAKIAFLTDRLSLSQEQAQRFWPVYNEFTAKRREIAQKGRQLRQANPDALTDQQVRDNTNQSFALRQQELNLEKEYFERFQKVISVRQTGQLFQAERDFTREVIKRVADRRGGRVGSRGDD